MFEIVRFCRTEGFALLRSFWYLQDGPKIHLWRSGTQFHLIFFHWQPGQRYPFNCSSLIFISLRVCFNSIAILPPLSKKILSNFYQTHPPAGRFLQQSALSGKQAAAKSFYFYKPWLISIAQQPARPAGTPLQMHLRSGCKRLNVL